jgi:hypothetical protein
MSTAVLILLLSGATKAATTIERPSSTVWHATMQRQLEEQGQNMANRMDEQQAQISAL